MNFTDQYIKMCDCEEVQKHFCLRTEDVIILNPCLPDQHDIQTWIKSYVNCSYRLLQDFYYWCALQRKNHIERVKGVSMEELWQFTYDLIQV